MLSNKPLLPIHDLTSEPVGLNREWTRLLGQAATIALARHHASPAVFTVAADIYEEEVRIEWSPPSNQDERSWGEPRTVTEFGACACVLAAMELMENLVVAHTAWYGTGVDYFLVPRGTTPEEAEDLDHPGTVRLEVSGTDQGSKSVLNSAMHERIRRASRMSSPFPTIVGVVGFRVRLIQIEHMRGTS